MRQSSYIHLEQVDPWRWRIPRHGRMRTDGVIYSDDKLIQDIKGDQCLE